MSNTNPELDHSRPQVQAEAAHLQQVTDLLRRTILELAGQKQNLTEYLVH